MKKLTVFLIMLFSVTAYAGFKGYNGNQDLRLFNSLKCSTGMSCTKVADQFVMTAIPNVTLASGNLTILGGESADASLGIFADEGDDSGDKFSFKVDTSGVFNFLADAVTIMTMSAVGDSVHKGTTPYLTMGDADAEDTGIAFDGNAQDYHMSLDDSTDDLVIGLGVAAGTTDAIRIDENQNVTFVQDVVGLGTDNLYGFLDNMVSITSGVTITAAECGSSFMNYGAVTIHLPEASTVIGCQVSFISGVASTLNVNPNDATDAITLLTNAAGDSIQNATLGNNVKLQAIKNDLWIPVGTIGPWTDAN